MTGPDWLTPEEEKALSKMVDVNIDFEEHERIREVPRICEGLGVDDSD
jgi:hypothetical protein